MASTSTNHDHHGMDDINRFSMEIMDDLASFDDSFDDPMEEMSGLMVIEEEHNKAQSLTFPITVKSSVDKDDESNHIDTDMVAYSKECFDPHHDHHYGHDNMHRHSNHENRDQQYHHHHHLRNYNTEGTSANVTDVSHEDLDEQIQISMSKLVQSMHRSEMSRSMLGQQQSAGLLFGGLGNILNGYSSIASGLAQSRTQINTYMNQVGNI
mmetsp:Transcript_9995/g.12604  ORF Transcript_9995/g.12604 Transcript_9995/m.12604 type:complete len:210 (+) Transcript_9995:72-701(+)